MGLLDDLLGSEPRQPAGGTSTSGVLMALMPIVLSMLSSRGPRGGGLGRLLAQLQRAGFGEQADSWVSRGANKPISPDAITQVFGRDGLEQISRRAGLSPDDASRGLSELLPEVIDRMTPDGDVPDADALTRSVADLARRLVVG